MKKQRRSLFLVLAGATIIVAAWSFALLSHPAGQTLDERAQDVGSQLKCPICQGESVQDSPSELARQMRGVIRAQLRSGKSEQQVIQYFVDRYGEQIVWVPRWQGFTLLAWLVPIASLLGGAVLIFFVLRDWHAAVPALPAHDEIERAATDESDLARYKEQLEQELAADDPIFGRYGREAH